MLLSPCQLFLLPLLIFRKVQNKQENLSIIFGILYVKIEFSGKVIKFFGDSITAGTYSPNLGEAGNDSWPKTFSTLVGATANVYAVGGSCITDSVEGDQYNIGTRVTQYVKSTDDIIIHAGGTNDFTTGKAVGAFGDTHRTTSYGSLNDICSYSQTTAPDADVIFITPIPYTKP